MKIAVIIARMLVGSLFIVSGLIKANDSLGFSYKLEEYFAESALDMPWLIPSSLLLAVIISVIEIILGFAVIFAGKIKITLWSLIAMLLFFAWLTYFTAACNDAQSAAMITGQTFDKTCVNDCGCFGDALRDTIGRSLTPWESFTKDIILLALTLIIFIERKKISFNSFSDDKIMLPLGFIGVAIFSYFFSWWLPIYFTGAIFVLYLIFKIIKPKQAEWGIAAVIGCVFFLFSYYTIQHLPVTDFRPYKIGSNVNDLMSSAEEVGLEAPKKAYIYTIKNSKTGETKIEQSDVFLTQQLWKEWDVVSTGAQITISDGYEPKVLSFSAYDTEKDEYHADSRYTASSWGLLHDPKYSIILVAYNLHKLGEVTKPSSDGITGIQIKLSKSFLDQYEFIDAIETFSNVKGINMTALSNSDAELVDAFKYEVKTSIPFLQFDEKELKTIVRSSPSIVLMKNGVIKGKWHFNDTPTLAELEEAIKK
jgi:uncharacterized membrane protein YphA (DoxX/SURF4 family)